MSAMALIAPGAFLRLTFAPQAATGSTAPSMWIGIVLALLLSWPQPYATHLCSAGDLVAGVLELRGLSHAGRTIRAAPRIPDFPCADYWSVNSSCQAI
jgi:hypothetical protein